MVQIKAFVGDSTSTIEDLVNDWLQSNNGVEVLDIKFFEDSKEDITTVYVIYGIVDA